MNHKKSILVTGACGGMGRATATLLAQKGYRVFALDVKACATEENIIPIVADVTSEDSVAAAFEEIRASCDSLYAIVHFAGIYMLDSLVEIDSESFRRIFDINLLGVFLINKIFLPLLNKKSRILITTSELASLDPLPFTGLYAVTKGALDKYAYSLRMELQLLEISVSVLRAGAVDTGMLGASTDALKKFCSSTKLYSCNAKRFEKIVNGVEARHIPAESLAKKAVKIIEKRVPSFAYSINKNPLLVLLNLLPHPLQLKIIKWVLK